MAARLSEPVAIGHLSEEWWSLVWTAWCASRAGDVSMATSLYETADALSDGCLNASLSVLRHNVGEGFGSVIPIPPTEDNVVSLLLPRINHPSRGSVELGDIPHRSMEMLASCVPGHHPDNIREHRPHVMVMSTGRCGTVSLYHLFHNSNLRPYHTYWFMQHAFSRWETLCRMHAGNFDDLSTAAEWAETRAAEWLGETPMIGLNHTDTANAPIFAAVHPKAKFVYLRRDPDKVLESFVSKGQWSDGCNHFRPVAYDFSDGFGFEVPAVTEYDGSKYHIEATEKFSRTFGEVMGDRWIEISSDRLFGQDTEEISRFLEFVGSDIDIDFAVNHFSRKINEKAHKAA